jgi:hypothetical protein
VSDLGTQRRLRQWATAVFIVGVLATARLFIGGPLGSAGVIGCCVLGASGLIGAAALYLGETRPGRWLLWSSLALFIAALGWAGLHTKA